VRDVAGFPDHRPDDRPDQQGDGVPVTVGTFNIHHGVGAHGRLNLEHTAETVDDAGLDVVALQEVDRRWSARSRFVDQAGFLAERLGMHMAFGPCLVRGGHEDGPREYGTALLSRHPIDHTHNMLLPRPRGGEQRALLEADVVVGDVTLRCLATHLNHRSRTERLAQVAAINATVSERDVPTVLLGDLNSRPGSPEIAAITRHLVDTWRVGGGTGGHTFSARSPHVRIDFVLASPGITVEAARVVRSSASDHLPVSVDLRLPRATYRSTADRSRLDV
jgi:endonuclease/exonuclease/phosphatase family metal-dependent hydrolase